jgi:hypothetical protein
LSAPARTKPFRPSLTTLDKAVSAKIYFENVYFPLLRLPPSREQRRLAMEAEMEQVRIIQGDYMALLILPFIAQFSHTNTFYDLARTSPPISSTFHNKRAPSFAPNGVLTRRPTFANADAESTSARLSNSRRSDTERLE